MAAPELSLEENPVTLVPRTEVLIVIVSVPPGIPPCEIAPPNNSEASLLYAIKSIPDG